MSEENRKKEETMEEPTREMEKETGAETDLPETEPAAEQEEAKKQAEKSIHTKSLFLSNMSHEIRTPLNALSGFSSILTEESIDNETKQQCNDIIQQNSELLLKLINDVIDLSSLEIGKMKFKFKECDIVALCRNVIDRDDVVDDAFNEIKEKLADMIYGGNLDAKTGLDLLMTAKYFERIGDHAVNIAEWVEYSITGQHRNNEHQDYLNN